MTFDPNKFVNTAVNEPNATTYPVAPEGEFKMLIDDDPKQLQPRDAAAGNYVGLEEISGVSQKTGKPYLFHQWTLNAVVLDDKVKEVLGQDKPKVRLRINLDFTDTGDLATGEGRNVKLGQLKEALDQNKPGWTPSQVLGAGPFIGRIAHSSNPNDPEKKYADVVAFARIS